MSHVPFDRSMSRLLLGLCAVIRLEITNTIDRPERLLKIYKIENWRKYLKFQRVAIKSGNRWAEEEYSNSLSRRTLRSYDDYLELQENKLNYFDLSEHERTFRRVLSDRLRDLNIVEPGMNALCLGARLGAEVAAFADLGCFALGVDLNPGPKNKFVLYGDFHNLQIASSSADIVYTNSIDHAFDLEKFTGEILRVIKPSGVIIIEPDPGTEERNKTPPDLWQTLSWRTIDDLLNCLQSSGITLVKRRPFEYPRNGEQLVFVPNK